ncbi:hypothetical protein [Halobacillus sp. Marseille-Q1614]|uniref:hypothetical protein n=1 Tax=Halobacillus sp. Marseille-Q1614 TaxID=2709134 RepID=UPI0015713D04|nr:hypothetical protein [Halobacillus sp. Marseille-Q1614]
MRHPYAPFIQLQLAAILVAVILAFVALFHLEHEWIILLMFYVLTISLLIESFVEYKKEQLTSSISQLLRAIILFIFTTILYF